MASLNPKPGSSSKSQHTTLVIAGKRQGFSLAEIRRMVGGSITKLSKAECSEWITRFSGDGLPEQPRPHDNARRNRKRSDATRMIDNDHVDHIARMGSEYFRNDMPRFLRWLAKNFEEIPFIEPLVWDDVWRAIRHFATAERAGQIIHVLKEMLERRRIKEASA